MNVRTVRRFSKRTISTLLSILMVISLFTVCMVGTVTTASAVNASWGSCYIAGDFSNWGLCGMMYDSTDGYWYYNYKAAKTGTITYKAVGDGSHWTGDPNRTITGVNKGDTVVFKVKDGNENDLSASKTTPHTVPSETYKITVKNSNSNTVVNEQAMTYDSTNHCYYYAWEPNVTTAQNFTYTIKQSSANLTCCSNETIAYDGRTEYIIFTVYPENVNSYGAILSRKTYNSPDRYAYVAATVYNYRNNKQITDDNNSEPPGYYVQNNWEGVEWNINGTTRREFSTYNYEIAKWYYEAAEGSNKKGDYKTDSSKKATPLYQGNFRQGSSQDNATLEPGIASGQSWNNYNFASLANGANRNGWGNNNSPFGSSKAVAKGLVDGKLSGDLEHLESIASAKLTQNGVEIPQFSDDFQTAHSTYQWKSSVLNFPFDTVKTAQGNTEYVYDASIRNNNRYLCDDNGNADFENPTKIKPGGTVDGTTAGLHGYFPFNNVNDTTHKTNINGFGTRFDISFLMPNDKQVGETGHKENLQFKFSGDDDVWVFLDGYLLLDMGGQHNKAEGLIDLTEGYYQVSTGNYQGDYASLYAVSTAGDKANDVRYNAKLVGATDNPWNNINQGGSPSQTAIDNVTKHYYNQETSEASRKITEILQQTNAEHTLTIFYMERGEWDSNFKMTYLLPTIDVVNDNKLTITQKVNGDNVNDGLRLKTMEIANKDIFVANVKTQYMDLSSVTDNMIKLPIDNNFTRRTNLNADASTPESITMQKNVSGTLYNQRNTTSGTNYSWIKSCYSWIDNSKLLDSYGEIVTPTQRAATNSGVGRPWSTNGLGSGAVPLLYDQSAIFYNQFSTKVNTAPGGTLPSYPVVNITEDEYIARFSTGADDTDTTWDSSSGIRNIANLKDTDIGNSGRLLDDYYTTHLTLVGASDKNGDTELNAGDDCYIKQNKSSFTFTHDIRVGKVVIEKLVDGSDKTENGKKTEYTFEIRYKNLFGDTATTYPTYADKTSLSDTEKEKLWEVIESETEEPWQTATLRGTRSGTDADGDAYTTDNNSVVAADGRFGMVAGSTVTFEGIPVGTMIQIREYSEQHPITDVTSSIGNVLFSGVVSENYSLVDGTVDVDNNKENHGTGKAIAVNITPTTATLDSVNKTLSTIDTRTTKTVHNTTNDTDEEVPNTNSFKMTNNATWKYSITNSYVNVPLFYRFIDRKVESGKPTGLANDYTYFTKSIRIKYDQLLDKVDVPGGGTAITKNSPVSESAQEMIAELSPQIINVICTYDLTKNGKYWSRQNEVYSNRGVGVEEHPRYDYKNNEGNYTQRGEEKNQFELVDITTKVKAVLNAMYGSNEDNSVIDDGEDGYAGLNENCGTGETNVVGLRDTIRNIIDQVIADYVAEYSTQPTKSQIRTALRSNNYFWCDPNASGSTQDKYYAIQATYANTLRRYDVDVQLYAPTGSNFTINDVNYQAGDMIKIKYSVPFNGISNLATRGVNEANYTQTGGTYASDMHYSDTSSQNIAAALGLDETANELFRIKISDSDSSYYIYFAYWERQVSYWSGDNVITEWTPVSTNFNYHLRVNDHVRLRAVYQKADGTRYDPAGAFTPIDLDAANGNISGLYSPITKTVKKIYWQIRDNVKYYRASGDADGSDYTILATAVEPLDSTDFEASSGLYITTENNVNAGWSDDGTTGTAVLIRGDDTVYRTMSDQQIYKVGYNVPNPVDNDTGKSAIGYGVSATDRTYNSYSKEVTVTDSTTGVAVAEKQDRTRIDIIFGSPTSDNDDIGISQVGFMVFKSPNYEDPADAVYGTATELLEALKRTSGNDEKMAARNLLTATSSAATNTKKTQNSKVVVDGNGGMSGGYLSTDGKRYSLQCSMAPVGSGTGKVALTNKNRYNVVFDVINNEISRQAYYTVFLVMKRTDGTFYISPTPATFNLRDVDPAIRNSDGQRAYLMRIKNKLQDGSGNITDTKPEVGSIISNYTTATNGRTLAFTNKITTWFDTNGTPYTGELVSLQVGKKSIDISDIKTGGNKGVLFKTYQDEEKTIIDKTYIDDPINTSSFDVIAVYKRIILGSQFDVVQNAHTSVSTVVKDSSGTVTPAFNKTYASVNTDTTYLKTNGKGQVVPYNHKLTVTVTADEGYTIDDSEVPNAVTGDTNISITKPNDSTWIAEVTTVLNANDSATDTRIATLLANLPSAVEKSYTFKIKTNPESLLSTSGNIKLDGNNIDTTQISNNEYVVTVLASQLNENGQKDFTLKAKTDVQNYDFSGWSAGITTGTAGEITYTFDANTMDGNTVTANYATSDITVTFKPNLSTLKSNYETACNNQYTHGNKNTHKYDWSLQNGGIKKVKVRYHGGDVSDTTIEMTETSSGSGVYTAPIPANAQKVQFEIIIKAVREQDGNWYLDDSNIYTLWGADATVSNGSPNYRWQYSALDRTGDSPITEFTVTTY